MRYLMFFMVMMLANVANAMDCEKVPDCASLGYTTQDDPYCAENGYMYCPLDHSYKKCVNYDCAKLGFTESDKSSWCGKLIQCKGNPRMTLCQNLCEIGDVYYADGTCGYADDYDGSKTPVGVVYWITDGGVHGKVINLHDLGRESEEAEFNPENPYDTGYTYFYWGYQWYGIPGITDYKLSDSILPLVNRESDLYNGKRNTAEILAYKVSNCTYASGTKAYNQYCSSPAAQAARDFYPKKGLEKNSKVGQGNWYLPAIGELMDLYGYDNAKITFRSGTSGATAETKKKVNATLNVLKSKGETAEPLTEKVSYWSSSELDGGYVWTLSMTNGYRGDIEKSAYSTALGYRGDQHLRLSLEF